MGVLCWGMRVRGVRRGIARPGYEGERGVRGYEGNEDGDLSASD